MPAIHFVTKIVNERRPETHSTTAFCAWRISNRLNTPRELTPLGGFQEGSSLGSPMSPYSLFFIVKYVNEFARSSRCHVTVITIAPEGNQ